MWACPAAPSAAPLDRQSRTTHVRWRERCTVLNDEDDAKTKQQLRAEIDALKEELRQRGAETAKSAAATPAVPVFSAPITRRESLVSWVAPVILSLPVVQGVGMVLKSGTAHAAGDDSIAALPTFRPTGKPVLKPTLKPSAAPTRAGRCVIAPTAAPPTTAPVASPTLGMGAAPDARAADADVVALGSARAFSLLHLAK